MKFQPHFLRIATLPMIAMLAIIAAAAICPVFAAKPQGESETERYVLDQLQKGEHADLKSKSFTDRFPQSKRELSASFIKSLLTSRDGKGDLRIHPHGIWIEHALITGKLDLEGQDIPHDVVMRNCTFADDVNFFGSNFAKGLELSGCTFDGLKANFSSATIRRDFLIYDSKFETSETTSFESARVGGVFIADDSKFKSAFLKFKDMRVDGRFSAMRCTFSCFWVEFSGARFADVFLNSSKFHRFLTIDFTRMQAEFISFNDVEVYPGPPSEILLQQMTFNRLSPVNPDQLRFLLTKYNAEFYTALETSWRTHGYPAEADKIFIAKKRAERLENCKSFLSQCNRPAWAWSMFQDKLAGYGKSLQNLLVWCVGFLIFGTFVFWNKKGMRLKDEKDAPHYAGGYCPFWYSLDLFLPIIKLGEADVWTPKDDRRWANLYRKVHIIIGSLFVPIGLAAWTGIIK